MIVKKMYVIHEWEESRRQTQKNINECNGEREI